MYYYFDILLDYFYDFIIMIIFIFPKQLYSHTHLINFCLY